jgi:hypothetical protein
LNEVACADIMCEAGFACDPGTQECVEIMVPPGADRETSEWSNGGENVPQCGGDNDCTEAEACEDLPFIRADICILPCGDGLACPDGFFCCDPFDPRVADGCLPANNGLAQACRNRP